jgi:hypothetical protein
MRRRVGVLVMAAACREHFDEIVVADAVDAVDAPVPMCGTTGADSPAWPMPNSPGSGLPHPSSFTLDTDTVKDDVTGLVWERNPSTMPMTWDQARNYCNTLALAGACWRLPHRIELVSIIDYLTGNPAAQMPSTASARYWAATRGLSGKAWAIDFTAGHSETRLDTETNRVRCVQVTLDPPSPRFTLIDASTARDEATGLRWQRMVDTASYSFAGAQSYCSGLPGGSWRMPSIHELLTIVDTSRTTLMIDPDVFPATPPSVFWSATEMFLDVTMGWSVDFTQGVAFRNQATMLPVRCVLD